MARPQMHPYNTRPTNTASPLGRLPNGLTPLRTEAYNISTNPPNPKLSFRAGDWMYVGPLLTSTITPKLTWLIVIGARYAIVRLTTLGESLLSLSTLVLLFVSRTRCQD